MARQPEEGAQTVESHKWSLEDFDVGSVIGGGRYGKVFHAKEKSTQLEVAIKTIRKASIADDMKEQVFLEIVILSLFKHPHIIRQFTFFHDKENLYTVMECASSNTLYDVLRAQKYKRFNEEVAAKYVWQVTGALSHMHSRLYMHRDVKPENILLDSAGNAKLGDFGWVSSMVRRPRIYCGTVEYMAPEIIKERFYTNSVDIWAVGVLTYELLVGTSPFQSSKPHMTRKKILEMNFQFPKIVQSAAREFISKLIVLNPRKRMALSKAQKHPWVTTHYTPTQPSFP